MHKQHAPKYIICEANWLGPVQTALKSIRTQVFIQEQNVPPALEWDGEDQKAVHLIALSEPDALALGCARLLDSSNLNEPQLRMLKVGRMAVLPQCRGLGIGKALLAAAIQTAKTKQYHSIRLSAQTQAIDFYAQAGFMVISEQYLDANIWHVDMQLELET